MLKKRNAADLSITIIILAVLGLIVLVVMMAIFSKETGRTVGTLESCEARGGNCNKGTCNDDEREIIGIKCKESGKRCCIGI